MNLAKIGFDLDATVVDNFSIFTYCIQKRTGLKFTYEAQHSFNFEIVNPECDWRDVVESFYDCVENHADLLKPFPGAIEFLEAYYKFTGEPLVFVTARGAAVIKPTLEWLNKWLNVPFVCEFVEENDSKIELMNRHGVTAFMDDRDKTIIEVSTNGLDALVIDHPWNQHVDEDHNIKRVNNWYHLAEIVSNYVYETKGENFYAC